MKKGVLLVSIFLVTLLFLVQFSSAGIFDFLKAKSQGNAQNLLNFFDQFEKFNNLNENQGLFIHNLKSIEENPLSFSTKYININQQNNENKLSTLDMRFSNSGNKLQEKTGDESNFGEQKTIIILVKQSGEQDPFNQSFISDLVFNNVTSFIKENSFNQTWLTGDTTPWLEYNSSWPPDWQDAVQLADPSVNFSNYNAIMAFIGNHAPHAYLGPITFETQEGNITAKVMVYPVEGEYNITYYSLVAILAHEWGHGFSMGHADGLTCDGPFGVVGADFCDRVPSYGNPFDMMGGSFRSKVSSPHYGAFFKHDAGWLDSILLQNPPRGTFRLLNQEENSNESLILIPYNENGSYYSFEYRYPVGFDSIIDPSWPGIKPGIYINYIIPASDPDSPEYYNTGLIDAHPETPTVNDSMLLVGESYTDYIKNFTITLVNVTQEYAEIWFTPAQENIPCYHIKPKIEINPLNTFDASPGDTIRININITNRDTLACNASSFSLQTLLEDGMLNGKLPENTTLNFPPSLSNATITYLMPQQSKIIPLYVILPPNVESGDGNFFISVTNQLIPYLNKTIDFYFSISCSDNLPSDIILIQNTTLCNSAKIYVKNLGIGTNVTLDCNGAVLDGVDKSKNALLISGSDSKIKNCNIKNYLTGIDIFGGNNLVVGNTLENNNYGLKISGPHSRNNSIINNNFMNNSINAFVNSSGSQNQFWIPDLGGNFWSDYKGVDRNLDSFGDTPYIVPMKIPIPGTDNIDYLPLINKNLIRVVGIPEIGNMFHIFVNDPKESNEDYLILGSFNNSPPIIFPDTRRLYLKNDPLFQFTLRNPNSPLLQNTYRKISANGFGAASITIPNTPEMSGQKIYSAMLVLDTNDARREPPYNVLTISHSIPIRIKGNSTSVVIDSPCVGQNLPCLETNVPLESIPPTQDLSIPEENEQNTQLISNNLCEQHGGMCINATSCPEGYTPRDYICQDAQDTADTTGETATSQSVTGSGIFDTSAQPPTTTTTTFETSPVTNTICCIKSSINQQTNIFSFTASVIKQIPEKLFNPVLNFLKTLF